MAAGGGSPATPIPAPQALPQEQVPAKYPFQVPSAMPPRREPNKQRNPSSTSSSSSSDSDKPVINLVDSKPTTLGIPKPTTDWGHDTWDSGYGSCWDSQKYDWRCDSEWFGWVTSNTWEPTTRNDDGGGCTREETPTPADENIDIEQLAERFDRQYEAKLAEDVEKVDNEGGGSSKMMIC